ncbi:MAG: PepSY domain-containing protein [Cyanobacteriota bacterium]
MALNKMTIRKIHRFLAPILFLPLVVTVLTGSLYQIALLNQNFDYYWLIQIHKGHWGPLNLQAIYPFLNGMGLLVMVATGLSMWLQTRPNRQLKRRSLN